MVKDHSDSKKGNPLPPATLFDLQQGLFNMHHHADRIAHTMTFVTLVVQHWLEWKIAQMFDHEGSIWWSVELDLTSNYK